MLTFGITSRLTESFRLWRNCRGREVSSTTHSASGGCTGLPSRPRITPWSVKQGAAAVAAPQEIPLYTDNARDALRRELWVRNAGQLLLSLLEGKQYLHARSAYAEAGASTDDCLLPTQRFFCRRCLQKPQEKASNPLCIVWMPTSQEKGLNKKLQQNETSSRRRTTKMVCSLARRSLALHVLIFWTAIAALGHISVPSVTELI